MQDDGGVVVIGSGPAGAIATKTLVDSGIDVTLLDAGSAFAQIGFTARVGGLTIAKFATSSLKSHGENVTLTGDRAAELYEELAPGGLSNHWSCAVPRFSPDDFRDGERAGEAYTWPVKYEDLAPWYDKVEPLLHISGSANGVSQLPAGSVSRKWELRPDWARVASNANGRRVVPLPRAYGAATTLRLSNNVFNAYDRLVKPLGRTGRLKTRFDARVIRLEWSKRTRRVVGIVFRDRRTGVEERLPCRAVVLAAGAVASAQILLQSKSDEFPDGLGNTHGVLGRYLHDHPLGKLVVDLASPVSVYPPAYVTRAPLDETEPLYAAACVQWTDSVMMARSLFSGHLGRLAWVGFTIFGTMPPSKANYVALDPAGKGKDGASAITMNILHPPESEKVLDESRDHLVALLSKAGLGPRIRIWHTEPAGYSVHYGGTCRMHASPEFGMLDGWNRLHAVPNVVVADSAAFTTGPEKNPVLTAMSLSARASERLATELRAGTI